MKVIARKVADVAGPRGTKPAAPTWTPPDHGAGCRCPVCDEGGILVQAPDQAA